MRYVSLLSLLLALCVMPVAAVIETYEFSDSALEKRYHELSQELRCPKCQNQNIADSNAPIAQDLRRLLFEQLEAGASDEEILAYMVARYGEFVRYRPGFDRATAVLWLAPAILLLLAALTVFMVLRKRGGAAASLSTEEAQRLQTILDSGDKPS